MNQEERVKIVETGQPFNFGYVPSPKDKRDYKLSKVNNLIGSVPIITPTFFSDISQLPILMQAQQPACVGFATASGMMATDKGAYSWDYSPRFLYDLAKRDDGVPNVEGTYYRQCLKEGQKNGVCDNVEFPNDVSLQYNIYKDWTLIPANAFTAAKNRLVKSYVAVDDLSLDGIKQAIYQNGYVLLGVQLGDEWWTSPTGVTSWAQDDILNPALRPPKNVVSGHAILAYGYDQDYIYFVNSWSTQWGRNGIGWFGEDYEPFVQEGWTFIDLAPEVIKNLSTQISILQKVINLIKLLLKKPKVTKS